MLGCASGSKIYSMKEAAMFIWNKNPENEKNEINEKIKEKNKLLT